MHKLNLPFGYNDICTRYKEKIYNWQIYANNELRKHSKIYFLHVLSKHIAIKQNVLLRVNYL